MSSCWDVPSIMTEATARGYGHLPIEVLREWATCEADLSDAYNSDTIGGVSSTEDGVRRKEEMLKRIDAVFNEKAGKETLAMYESYLREMFITRLEDPGLMHNFEYFDVPSSEYMLGFYISIWTGKMADAMIYLHNYGWDLKGKFGPVPSSDVWFQMSSFEAMNISERIKAQSIVDWIGERIARAYFLHSNGDGSGADSNQPLRVTAFGGGNMPEMYYKDKITSSNFVGFPVGASNDDSSAVLPVVITVFDDGLTRKVDELYPDDQLENINYIHENLFRATQHLELQQTQDLVWMHGVSMYLGPKVPMALLSGFSILKPAGEMIYDYLIMTESMRRVLSTQGWPKGRGEMFIYDSPDAAIAQARKDIEVTNQQLSNTAFFDIVDIKTTTIEPWGPTNIRVTLKKYSQ